MVLKRWIWKKSSRTWKQRIVIDVCGRALDVILELMRIWLSFLACSTLPRCTFFHFTICRERTEMTHLHRNQAIFLWKQRSKATAVPRFWPYHQLWSISESKLAVHGKAYLAAHMIINLMKYEALKSLKKEVIIGLFSGRTKYLSCLFSNVYINYSKLAPPPPKPFGEIAQTFVPTWLMYSLSCLQILMTNLL